MKRIIYYHQKVISYEEHNGESITLGTDAFLFIGTEKECRRKVKELSLDYADYDLSSEQIPSCSPRQIRLWLLSLGVTDAQVIALINSLPEAVSAATLIEYQYASVFERNHPFVDQVGLALGLTLDQIDDGFKIASEL